jgi:transposase, IS30 family
MSYTRLTLVEREQILAGLAAGSTYHQIAATLGRSVSTISREVVRNQLATRKYSAVSAQYKAQQRARCHARPRKLVASARLWRTVRWLLARRWSPEQIAQTLNQRYPDDPAMQVSHESIYTYLYVLPRGELKKELIGYLRRHSPRRRGRRSREQAQGDQRGQIPDLISIDERPAEVADRSVPGHWEGDLIIGKDHQSAIGTLVERTTRTVILVHLTSKDAESVRIAFAREMLKVPTQMAKSLTYDRGREMVEHRLFTEQTNIQVYFAHPQSPWQRGTCENTNGLIRDFFPKGTDFGTVTRKELKRVQKLLNERPRKTLNWRTPAEAFAALMQPSENCCTSS